MVVAVSWCIPPKWLMEFFNSKLWVERIADSWASTWACLWDINGSSPAHAGYGGLDWYSPSPWKYVNFGIYPIFKHVHQSCSLAIAGYPSYPHIMGWCTAVSQARIHWANHMASINPNLTLILPQILPMRIPWNYHFSLSRTPAYLHYNAIIVPFASAERRRCRRAVLSLRWVCQDF